MASNSKNLGELLNTTETVDPSFVSDQDNTSTGYFDLPNGTTAQRPTPTAGMIRFNSTFNLAEYYTGTEWKAVDTPPQITSVSPSNFDTSGTTITVTGSNFQSGITAKLQGNDGTNYNAATTTRVSSSEVTFDVTAAMVTDNDPFKVILTNTSGLSGEYESVYYATDPVWTTSAGSLGTYYNYNRTGLSYTVAATSSDADDTITYAITSGALPSGLSLNTSTGAITGDGASVGSSTTYTFEITATATGEGSTSKTTARTFTLTNGANVVTSYTSTGSGTFSVPSGITAVNVLVVAGGGGGGVANGGGGGAGGLVYATNYPVTPGGSVSYTVGAGGNGDTNRDGTASNGQNSVFGQLTANGGGGGGSRGSNPNSYTGFAGAPGGSGGGGSSSDNPGQNKPGGSATQPGNGGHPTGQGYGNAGGQGGVRSPHRAGGGGGAGAAGTNANNGQNPGGAGRQYDIGGQGQVYYAGGGGGYAANVQDSYTTNSYTAPQMSQGGQGGGGNSAGYDYPDTHFTDGIYQISGVANRGGGGGGVGPGGVPDGTPAPVGHGGNGGSGIVIVSY